MANDTTLTITGNLTADPELRFTPNGAAVASFTIASTPRTFDRQANEWKDGDALFVRCSAWRDLGENVAESLGKGMAVVATGYLKARNYQDREGNNRTAWELDVQNIGPDLRRQTAKVTKVQRGGGGGGGQFGGGAYGGRPSTPSAPPADQDAWSGAGGWDAPSSNEPPF